jgi:hypothetical protein
LAAPFAAAAEPAPKATSMKEGGPRLRANDGRSAAILLDGLDRSETFRHLVDEIEKSDVIVYLEVQPALKKSLAGKLTWITATGSFRYVRISLNPDLANDAMIATLGHELQHAVEVVREASIVSTGSLSAYYAKHGLSMASHSNGWDTEAARQAGYDVRRELSGGRASRVAESIQAFNPLEWHIVYRRARGMLPP